MTNISRRRSTPTPTTDMLSEEKKSHANGEPKEVRWVQIRLIPIWLRIVIILILVIVAAVVGSMVGYSVIGEGKAMDVFKPATWQHIFDIIGGKE